ncbi:riboflavin synthase [Corynebacterium stationis]|nr:riboflavin synthase [Corynebacterium stationis]AMJ44657.1 riboflavin synthase subunit alpha [Corynebacterium stationis]AQX71114.1 riboflavin synthase [Corynebacterium stationis]ASJ18802.1 riboflavin synthase subunit alpha [Corynebacterium stationis]HJG64657.1 riboflavin synthase [Corynebacterium stationis]
MFTGLVEEKGKVIALEELGDSIRMQIEAPVVTADAQLGDSISVNGVCLTVAELGDATFIADIMQESLNRSALGELAPQSTVNLERALLPTTRLGGHIVQGHVDGTAKLISRTPSEHWDILRFELPADLARYVVEKGSIAISGTSLTVSAIGEAWFEVSLIPVTLRDTILGDLADGDLVNLEVDVLAKYVEKMVRPQGEV